MSVIGDAGVKRGALCRLYWLEILPGLLMLVGSSACGLLLVLKVTSHLPAADTSTDVSEPTIIY